MKLLKNKTMNNEEKEALKIVLDYVERWNKKDEEKDVANAAALLEGYIYQETLI